MKQGKWGGSRGGSFSFPASFICCNIFKIIWSIHENPAALFIHIKSFITCVCIYPHVISLMSGPDIILLCAPPPSYDPNPQVWVCVCVCSCVSHGPILPPSVSQLISVSMQDHNRGGKKYREQLEIRCKKKVFKVKKKKKKGTETEYAMATFMTLPLT